MMSDAELEALHDELGGEMGDPYHCPRHPDQIISDRFGLHEAPCGACEAEMDAESDEVERREPEEPVEAFEQRFPESDDILF